MASADNRSFRSFEEVDHGDLFGVLLRGRWLIVVIFLVVFCLGAAYAFLSPVTYEWRALVQLQIDNHLMKRIGLTNDSNLQKKIAEEQVKQFNSSTVLLPAIKAVQSNRQADKYGQIQKGNTATTVDSADRAAEVFQVEQIPNLNNYGALKKDLKVNLLDSTFPDEQVLELTYRSKNLHQGQEMVEASLQAYLQFLENEQRALVENKVQFLEARLPSMENNARIAQDVLAQFQANNPEVKLSVSIQNLLKDSIEIDARRIELRLQRDALLSHYDSGSVLIKSLDKNLSELEKEPYILDELVTGHLGPEADLLRLMHDAETKAILYKVAQAQLDSVSYDGAITASFDISTPVVVQPNRKLLLAVSLFLGVLFGAFVVLIRAFLRPMVYSTSTLQDLSQLTTLGIPDARAKSWCARLCGLVKRRSRPVLLTDTQPFNPALESLRALRATFDGHKKAAGALRLAFVGPTADVGKTFVAANTASLLVLEGKRVLLIDTDMRRSHLHEYFGYEATSPGLAQVLSGAALVQEALLTPRDGLTVLPAGQCPDYPTELLLQPTFASLMDELCADYDYVILTSPPVLPVADSLAILRQVDAGYMVIRADQSSLKEVYDALERLYAASVYDVLQGAVLNGVKHLGFGEGISYKQHYTYS